MPALPKPSWKVGAGLWAHGLVQESQGILGGGSVSPAGRQVPPGEERRARLSWGPQGS